MNRVIGTAQRILLFVVLVGSGSYTLVYLYRWEWNRALISGLFFLASEIAMATSLILRRLSAPAPAPAPGPALPATPTVYSRLRQAGVDRPDPFAWLRPDIGTAPVFVPILLGAGAVLSALAYVVERAAEATALPAADRSLARRLDSLALPPGGLQGRRPQPLTRLARPRQRATLRESWPGVVAVVVAGLGVTLGVHALRESAESRPDRRPLPAATTILVRVSQRGASSGPEATASTAEALWTACRDEAGDGDRAATATQVGPDRALLVVTPGVGPLGTRRLSGCLADRTLSLVEAEVVSVDHVA